eukprot:jgi/Ulvmu1/4798/UM020_0083.1
MSVSLPIPGSSDAGITAGSRRLLIDPGCLVLSSDGYSNADGLQEPSYGVPCLLHNDGAVGTVLVSSLTCTHDAQSDDHDVPEEVQQRIRALWRHPHRCITPPLGLSTCRAPSGTTCLLYIEQLRSTSSLQSMILSQMQSPDRPLYSNRQALDWLIQLASALAHLHSLAPEMPHGRLSASVIAVPSAADISLGRCVTATAGWSDHSPSSKRAHVMNACSLPPMEPLGDVLVPEAFRPHRASVPEWRSYSSMPLRRTSASISAAFSPSPESSVPGQLSLSELSEHSGSQGEVANEQTQDSIPAPWGRSDHLRARDWAVDESMQRLSIADTRPKKSVAGVSIAQVPGMANVFKVSLPASDDVSSRSSLHDVAEAAVWARTDSGSETKQHGGALFARAKVSAGSHSHSAPLFKRESSSSGECTCVAPDGGLQSVASTPQRELDAADTEHVLLQNPMIWNPSSHPAAPNLPLPVVQRAEMGQPLPHVPGGPSPAGAWFTRVVPRPQGDPLPVTPFWDMQRGSDDGAAPGRPTGNSSAAKRSRSGLSQRLPSLVELPGAEARCAAQHADLELDCASARDSLDGTLGAPGVLSLPGQARQAMPYAAEPAALGGVDVGHGRTADAQHKGDAAASGDDADGSGPGMPPGMRISTALARLRYAAPVLARVRSTVLHAATGRAEAAGQPQPDVTHRVADAEATAVPHDREVRRGQRSLGEQKQRGGLSVMQLLQHSRDHDRERWRGRLLSRKASYSGLLRPGSKCGTAMHIGRWHDDLPYLAPEVLEGGEASPAADCFALGVIMYEVIKRELVSADIAMHADLNDLSDEDALRSHVARIVDGERPRVPVSWPAEVKEVIQLCWQDNPFDRPTLASVHASLVHYQSTNPQ